MDDRRRSFVRMEKETRQREGRDERRSRSRSRSRCAYTPEVAPIACTPEIAPIAYTPEIAPIACTAIAPIACTPIAPAAYTHYTVPTLPLSICCSRYPYAIHRCVMPTSQHLDASTCVFVCASVFGCMLCGWAVYIWGRQCYVWRYTQIARLTFLMRRDKDQLGEIVIGSAAEGAEGEEAEEVEDTMHADQETEREKNQRKRLQVRTALEDSNVSPALEDSNVSPALEDSNVSPALEDSNVSPALEDSNVQALVGNGQVQRATMTAQL